MNVPSQETRDVFPPIEPPRVHTSKLTKWTVVVLVLVVCGIPSLGLYWLRQHFQVYPVGSVSMEPTIMRGERIFTDMQYFRHRSPVHGEVVVFMREDKPWIKRIAAMPGDTIEGRNDVIYLNGKIVSEPYAQHTGPATFYLQNFGPIIIKAGECFVLGDNRGYSLDSRTPEFGLVPIATIVGRPLFIINTESNNRMWERIK